LLQRFALQCPAKAAWRGAANREPVCLHFAEHAVKEGQHARYIIISGDRVAADPVAKVTALYDHVIATNGWTVVWVAETAQSTHWT
jgi:hypothetical protein